MAKFSVTLVGGTGAAMLLLPLLLASNYSFVCCLDFFSNFIVVDIRSPSPRLYRLFVITRKFKVARGPSLGSV